MKRPFPIIDPNVKHVGVSKLRIFNSTELRKLNGTVYVIQDDDKPLAVLLSYETFLLIQSAKEVMPVRPPHRGDPQKLVTERG